MAAVEKTTARRLRSSKSPPINDVATASGAGTGAGPGLLSADGSGGRRTGSSGLLGRRRGGVRRRGLRPGHVPEPRSDGAALGARAHMPIPTPRNDSTPAVVKRHSLKRLAVTRRISGTPSAASSAFRTYTATAHRANVLRHNANPARRPYAGTDRNGSHRGTQIHHYYTSVMRSP